MHRRRIDLMQKLFPYSISNSLKAEWKRRDESVEAVTVTMTFWRGAQAGSDQCGSDGTPSGH